MNDKKYIVSSTPHIRDGTGIRDIMTDVVFALIPAVMAATYFFGLRALLLMALSVASSVFFEAMFQRITKQDVTINDWSAVVTGLLLALNLPASSPFWMPVAGSLFAIVIVKQLFGGIGQNFMNPALAGRAFLQISYTLPMNRWTEPVLNPFRLGTDAVSTATPLAMLKESAFTPDKTDYIKALLGNIGGSMGETCSVALLIGAVYLLLKKIISWRIPVAYLLTFSILSFFIGRDGFMTGAPVYEMLLGGILLGAFFMATDYSSSPVTPMGQLIMGFGCGLLTFLIRHFGGYPEGVCYSILIMNLLVPLIDRYVRPRVYGVRKEARKNA